MSLRIRLALALLLLSVLPLAGLAVFSYSTSSRAIRSAAEEESAALARDLAARVDSAAEEVDDRIRAVASLPTTWSWRSSEPVDAPAAAPLEGAAAESAEESIDAAYAELSAALPFIEQIAFVPRAPEPPAPPTAVAPEAPSAPPAGAEAGVAAAELGRAAEALELSQAALEQSLRQRGEAADLRRELERVRAEVAAAVQQAREAQARRTDLSVRVTVDAPETVESSELDEEALPLAAPRPLTEPVSAQVAAGDRVVGEIRARIKAKELLESVLGQTDRARDEIPFALDAENRLYVSRADDSERLESVPEIRALRGDGVVGGSVETSEWVVVSQQDPESGFRYGIARPLSSAMAQLRAATARNFSLGLMLVGLALAGMVPISGRLVRDVRQLEQGAARLAEGDLEARVEVRSRDELGRLATTFNRMAGQIAEHQQRLIEQERLRKEEEISRRLLAAENERRRRELEEAREFQLSLLPRELPRREGLDVAVSMTTATEVGGDYYDFLDAPDGALVFAVGDATGHGAAAGTMVTAVKGLFAGGGAGTEPAEFLKASNGAVHRMGLVRRAMALLVGHLTRREIVLSAAGMPPALHFRNAEGSVREIALAGTPLGARADFPYEEARLALDSGDALLLLSDGLPELPNAAGEPYGYERLVARFGDLARDRDAASIVAGLEAAAHEWTGGSAPADDLTFLVLRFR